MALRGLHSAKQGQFSEGQKSSFKLMFEATQELFHVGGEGLSELFILRAVIQQKLLSFNWHSHLK